MYVSHLHHPSPQRHGDLPAGAGGGPGHHQRPHEGGPEHLQEPGGEGAGGEQEAEAGAGEAAGGGEEEVHQHRGPGGRQHLGSGREEDQRGSGKSSYCL